MDSKSLSILFIKLKHFGDVLLMTPALAAVRAAYPNARITALLREGTHNILASSGLVDEILTTVPPERENRAWSSLVASIKLVKKLREQPFDIVFELTDGDRGRWLGVCARASLRCVSTYGWRPNLFWSLFYHGLHPGNWHLCHRAEKDHQLVRAFLPQVAAETPPLVFQADAQVTLPEGPFVVLHVASRWKRKLWRVKRWAAVGDHLTKKGLRCLISSGPDEDEISFAKELCAKIGSRAQFTGGKLSWAELAAYLRAARLFVGIDTAAMHLAAACECPVVALFGPSIDHHWHPWRTEYEIVSPGAPLHHRFPEFLYDAPKRSMLDIQVEDVLAACDRMLSKEEAAA